MKRIVLVVTLLILVLLSGCNNIPFGGNENKSTISTNQTPATTTLPSVKKPQSIQLDLEFCMRRMQCSVNTATTKNWETLDPIAGADLQTVQLSIPEVWRMQGDNILFGDTKIGRVIGVVLLTEDQLQLLNIDEAIPLGSNKVIVKQNNSDIGTIIFRYFVIEKERIACVEFYSENQKNADVTKTDYDYVMKTFQFA